jgi:hypothetical protein
MPVKMKMDEFEVIARKLMDEIEEPRGPKEPTPPKIA